MKASFSYGAGVDNSGIALFRGSNVPANVWVTSYIKFIPRNESGANMTSKYTSALNAFKNDVHYGDSASESEARTIIENTTLTALPNATIDTDVIVYVVSQNGSQYLSTVDKFASSGNKRWGFNYLTGSDISQNLHAISSALYFWQNQSLTTQQIGQQVSSYINSTK
jgi:hypothetical protein